MDTISIKANLKSYYDQEADLRNLSAKQEWKLKAREDFCNFILSEKKASLLELGSGTGNDSSFFMSLGLEVTALDLSSEMVNKCREKSIKAYEMDFYDLSKLNMTFDCIWAMNSLLHVPKADLPQVLSGINSVLNPKGLFYMGVYGGVDSESDFANELSDIPRFFSFYSKNRISSILSEFFQILSFEQFDVGRNIDFQSIIMQKK